MLSSLYFILEVFSSYYGNVSPLNFIFITKKNDNRYKLICPFVLEVHKKLLLAIAAVCILCSQVVLIEGARANKRSTQVIFYSITQYSAVISSSHAKCTNDAPSLQFVLPRKRLMFHMNIIKML